MELAAGRENELYTLKLPAAAEYFWQYTGIYDFDGGRGNFFANVFRMLPRGTDFVRLSIIQAARKFSRVSGFP